MFSRREFSKLTAVAGSIGALGGGIVISSCADGATSIDPSEKLRMPDESEPHARTWMAFGPSEEIWGADLLPVARANLAAIAKAIAKHEPVSMLVRKSEFDLAKNLVGNAVTLVEENMDDFWIRDTGPVFVISQQGTKGGINFNFNGWGQKQNFGADAGVARAVAKEAKVAVVNTSLVLEGGGIEVDGQGTAIITESCVLNPNRNPGLTKEKCEIELKRLLGLEKIIWLTRHSWARYYRWTY